MATSPIAQAAGTALGGLAGMNFSLIGGILLFCIVILVTVVIWKKVRGRNNYNILVKVIPRWSFKESKKMEPFTPKATLFNRHPKQEYREVPIQTYSVYYVPGCYKYNKSNGVHELILKEKGGKSVVADIGYKFFKPILFGKFNRTITLWRASPEDYKPCDMIFKGQQEISHIYDSESLYADLRAQEQIEARYKKQGKILQYLPFILAFLCIIGMIIWGVIIQKSLEANSKALGNIGSQLVNASRYLAASCKTP
jgi:hypothetical protein